MAFRRRQMWTVGVEPTLRSFAVVTCVGFPRPVLWTALANTHSVHTPISRRGRGNPTLAPTVYIPTRSLLPSVPSVLEIPTRCGAVLAIIRRGWYHLRLSIFSVLVVRFSDTTVGFEAGKRRNKGLIKSLTETHILASPSQSTFSNSRSQHGHRPSISSLSSTFSNVSTAPQSQHIIAIAPLLSAFERTSSRFYYGPHP
jgi:hypothetical protein